MKVGIPQEVKNHEYRVAITPAGVHELVRAGHEVFVEAGRRGRLVDPRRGVRRRRREDPADAPTTCGATGDLVLKVKEPIAEEYHRMRAGQVLFTYLHLAASQGVHRRAARLAASPRIAYETVQLPDGSLPLLAPMSEVAGRLAPQVGAYHLMRARRRPRRADGRRLRRVRGQGRRDRRRRLRHERRRDRARHAGRGAAARQEHRPAARRPTRSTRATCRRSRPTPTRSSGPCSTPTWSSARCWCPGAKAPTLVTNELVVADEAGLRCSSTSPSTRAAASRTPGRPRTPTRPTRCTTRCSTAWRTCPARCRTPRPTR